MFRLDDISQEKLLDGLIVLFYVAMGIAALSALMGSPGWGFMFLLAGAVALVVRTSMETVRRRDGRASGSPPPPINR